MIDGHNCQYEDLLRIMNPTDKPLLVAYKLPKFRVKMQIQLCSSASEDQPSHASEQKSIDYKLPRSISYKGVQVNFHETRAKFFKLLTTMRPHRDDVKRFGAKILENCKLTSWIKKCLKRDFSSVEEIYEQIDHVRASPEYYFGCTYDLKPELKYSKDACIRRGLSDFNQKFKEVYPIEPPSCRVIRETKAAKKIANKLIGQNN